jgi:hypothetical protein
MDIGETFATVIGLLLMAYVGFVVITQLIQQTPGFGYYGWAIFGALIAGIIIFLKFGLFKD